MPKITSVRGRVLYNSRGSKTVEVDVIADNNLGRVCAPSGASVGIHEVVSFPNGPEQAIKILHENEQKFIGIEAGDPKIIYNTLHEIDDSANYSNLGGGIAFATSIACAEAASRAINEPLYKTLSDRSNFTFPRPLGNILGGGVHAGPGTPDIQEILVCAIGANTIKEAVETNISVHNELRNILQKKEPYFTNGRGDEGGWAPRLDNDAALEVSVSACESLGFTLGKDVSLGVDFAASTQWDQKKLKYNYERQGFENDSGEQIEYVSEIIKKYKLIYAEDAVHEEAFEDMAEITKQFPNVLIVGDDLITTSRDILTKAVAIKACNAAILKVNQAGSLYDAMQFAKEADANNIKIITSHRSGESNDYHISHIGVATGSKMLKIGIVGGERMAKINELLRLSEHDLICGMTEL